MFGVKAGGSGGGGGASDAEENSGHGRMSSQMMSTTLVLGASTASEITAKKAIVCARSCERHAPGDIASDAFGKIECGVIEGIHRIES